MAEHDDIGGPTAFRDAITQARREAVEVLPQFGPVAPPVAIEVVAARASPPRFEYRVERTKGSRKRRARALAAMGRRGWELVAVDDGFAYLRRPRG